MSMILGAHPKLDMRTDYSFPSIVHGHYGDRDVVHGAVWTARYGCITKNTKYVFMLRNLYAVVNSMMSLGEPSWADKFAVEEISRSIIGISDWRQQHNVLPHFGKSFRERDTMALATICAYLKTYMLAEYRKHELNVIPVRYEELVKEPRASLSSILEWIGVGWDESVLSHHEHPISEPFAGNDPQRAIDTSSVDKWKRCLSGEDVERISSVIGEMDDIFDGFAGRQELCRG